MTFTRNFAIKGNVGDVVAKDDRFDRIYLNIRSEVKRGKVGYAFNIDEN